jgi:thiamine biosynthesis lipoprotein
LGRAAGKPVAVGQHTAAVVARAISLREVTDGLFDPAPTIRYQRVPTGGSLAPIASSQTDGAGQHPAGRELQVMADGLVRLAPPGEPDFGAIGKGYAADLVLRACRDLGAVAALVAFGVSSISCWAAQGQPAWRIGVRSPGSEPNVALGVLSLRSGAVATSSNDEQPGHLRDPRTGQPVDESLVQATVLAPDGMTADAVSTALMVGGLALAVRLSERLPQVQTILVTPGAVLASPSLNDIFQVRQRQAHQPVTR